MKKVLIGLLVALVFTLVLPTAIQADTPCCDYEVGSCCWRMCCAKQVYWYSVSYFEKVESGFYTNWGTPMYTGVWTVKYVEAHNSREAAELLGLRAGYSCFVARVLDYVPPEEVG